MSQDKLKMSSPDMVNQNIEKLAELFPNCFTETAEGKAIDFDLLKQELNHEVVEGTKERYRLEWPGKKEAIVTANLPTTKTLRPVREDSVDFDNTENLYIEGDNLEVLKLLQESYLGKVKMIYIDPPYNTGNDFVYKDNFTQDSEEFKQESGLIDEYNQRLVDNPETAGRYHSDWLSMMYPRLKLARNLLKDDGVIFISIDDNEVHNLRKVSDDVFGEINMLGCFVWHRRQNVDSRNYSNISPDHEYILAYGKTSSTQLKGKSIDTSKYKNPDNDPRGPWASIDLSGLATKDQRPNLHYPLVDPDTKIEYPPNPNRGWSKSLATMEQMISEKRVLFPKKPTGRPREKKFLNNLNSVITGFSTWLNSDEVGFTTHGTREFTELFGGKHFDFPKPSKFIQILINQGVGANDIILDFFSGSASSAHATMQLNAKDGGSRKHIMVQIPETTDEKSVGYQAGYKNICEIGKERIRRAGSEILEELQEQLDNKKAELENTTKGQLALDGDEKVSALKAEIKELQEKIDKLDIGFRVYRLDESNMQDVYYKPQDYQQENLDLFSDNVKPDRTDDDLLAQVMLDWGLPLSLPIEQTEIDGKKVFKVAGDSLYACFSEGINEAFAKELAKEAPMRIVFRDKSFASDTAKINVKQLLKQLSPDTEMRVI